MAANRKPAYLRKLRIERVDRVADPANADARITLFKSSAPVTKSMGLVDWVEAVDALNDAIKSALDAGNVAQAEDLVDALDINLDALIEALHGTDPDEDDPEAPAQVAMAKATIAKSKSLRTTISRTHPGASDLLPDGWVQKGATMAIERENLDPDVAALITELEAQLAEANSATEAVQAELATALAAASAGAGDATDDVTKALDAVPEPVRKALDEAQAIAKAAQEEVAILRKADRTRQFIAKAEAYPNIGGAAELGPVLMEVADGVSEDTFKSLETYLKAANALADEAHRVVTKERGSAGVAGATSDVATELEVITKSLRDGNPQLSEQQATAQALAQNPELYSRYLDAKRP